MAKAKIHPDQQELPGAEQSEYNSRITNAAKRYKRERDARIAANEKEKDAHEYLLKAMKDEGLTHYRHGGIEVFVDTSEKCKVSSPDANGEAEKEN